MTNIRLMRWTLLFAAFMLVMKQSHSFPAHFKHPFADKSLHTTYFMTPEDKGIDVRASVTMGKLENGICVYEGGQYNLGDQIIETGDYLTIESDRLQEVAGDGYSCMAIYYYFNQPVVDTVQLVWDGDGYVRSVPSVSTVKVL